MGKLDFEAKCVNDRVDNRLHRETLRHTKMVKQLYISVNH